MLNSCSRSRSLVPRLLRCRVIRAKALLEFEQRRVFLRGDLLESHNAAFVLVKLFPDTPNISVVPRCPAGLTPFHEAEFPVAVAVHDSPSARHIAVLLGEDLLELREVGRCDVLRVRVLCSLF